MKQLSIYLLVTTLMLFCSIKVTAQTECPNIEWMRFYNDMANYSSGIFNIDSADNSLVVGYYNGSPSWGSYTFPSATNYMPNCFIAKVDSADNPLWLHVAKTFTNGGSSAISKPLIDSNGFIYAALTFKWKTEFAGVTYIGNAQKNNSMIVKMNQQGQVLTTHLFDSTTFVLFHIDDSLNYYCFAGIAGTYKIGSHTFISNGGIDYLVFKLNSQFELLWAKQIGGTQIESLEGIVADSQNNVYVAGRFNSPTLNLGNTQLANPYSATGTYDIYIAKITSNGQFDWANQAGAQSTITNCTVSDLELDSNNNLFVSGYLKGELSLNNNPISSQPSYDFNSFLIKYTPITGQFSSMVLTEGENYGGALLYLPHKNTMVLSGLIAGNDTVDFGIEQVSASNADFYVLGLDLNTEAEKMTPKWVIYSEGDGRVRSPFLVKDLNENLYLSGVYNDVTGSSVFGSYTFPSIPPGGGNNVENAYQAKLGFLSREVTDSNGVLSAVQDSAIYQWLDCDNAMQSVAGATSQSFQPTQPGSYAVRVSNSFCSVVSECISTTGISESQRLRQTEVYPNPVRETLHLSHLPLGTQVSVFDVLGRAVYTTTATNAKLNISTRLWSPGVYMLRLSKDGVAHLEKVVKE